MALLDTVFLIGLLVSICLGLWRGFVYEVLAVLNWLLALLLAQWLGEDVGRWLPLDGQPEALVRVVGYVLVFVVSVFVGGLVVWAIPKLVEQAGLRPVDRMLGGAFGVLRAAILMLALTVGVLMTSFHQSAWWQESYVAHSSVWALQQLKPLLPAGVAQYLP
jgi:membrane protein required for colicin V production